MRSDSARCGRERRHARERADRMIRDYAGNSAAENPDRVPRRGSRMPRASALRTRGARPATEDEDARLPTPMRKAAILIMALGPEVAGQVMAQAARGHHRAAHPRDRDGGQVPSEEKPKALGDFVELRRRSAGIAFGGEETAKQILEAGFGTRNAPLAAQPRDQLQRDQELRHLRRSTPLTVANYLKNEHPQTVARGARAHGPARQRPDPRAAAGRAAGQQSPTAWPSSTRPTARPCKVVEEVLASAACRARLTARQRQVRRPQAGRRDPQRDRPGDLAGDPRRDARDRRRGRQ